MAVFRGFKSGRWAGIALLLAAFIFSLEIVSSGHYFTLDDGYYYLRIARHIAAGGGATFDGLHPTNGFHPLWQLVLVPIFWFTSDPGMAELAAAVLLGALLAVAAFLVYRYALQRHGIGLAFFGSLVWLILNYRLFFMGVEYGLECVLLLAIAVIWQKSGFDRKAATARSCFYLGVLLSLAFLSRLDAILLAAVLAGWMGWKGVNRNALGVTLAPLGLSAAAYVLAGLYAFGHVVPISAAVKRANSLDYLLADPVYQRSGWLVSKIILALEPLQNIPYGSIGISVFGFAGLIGAYLVFLNRTHTFRTWYCRFIEPLLPFILYGWASYLLFILVYHGDLSFQPWYYVVQRWLPVMGLMALLEWVPERWPIFRSRLLPAVCLALMLWILTLPIQLMPFRAGQPAYEEARNATIWIGRNLEAGAVLGSWNAGYLGYHAGRTVINLDGLVNSWTYQEELRFDLCAYFDREGIGYLADYFYPDGIRRISVIPEMLPYGRCLDRMEIIWQQLSADGTWALKVIRIEADGR